MSIKKLFKLPIMQAMYASIEVVAETEEEAINKFHQMNDEEMGYPFDDPEYNKPHFIFLSTLTW